jgi:hypothetical protein
VDRHYPQPLHRLGARAGSLRLLLQPTAIADGVRSSFAGMRQRDFR